MTDEVVASEWTKAAEVPGARNLENGVRNVCYMNAVIQCLSNVNSFSEYFRNEKYLHTRHGAICTKLGELFKKLWSEHCPVAINVDALRQEFFQTEYGTNYNNDEPHTAGLFLSDLLSALHTELRTFQNAEAAVLDANDRNTSYESILKYTNRRHGYSKIAKIFSGVYKFHRRCKYCGYWNFRTSRVHFINLTISATYNFPYVINHLVHHMDTLTDCTMCHAWTSGKFSISKFPKVLVINLPYTVDFTLTKELDLSAIKSYPAKAKLNPIYKLQGVVYHCGDREDGHYYAYCRNKKDKAWYLLDDSLEHVYSKQHFVQTADQPEILFYKLQVKKTTTYDKIMSRLKTLRKISNKTSII